MKPNETNDKSIKFDEEDDIYESVKLLKKSLNNNEVK